MPDVDNVKGGALAATHVRLRPAYCRETHQSRALALLFSFVNEGSVKGSSVLTVTRPPFINCHIEALGGGSHDMTVRLVAVTGICVLTAWASEVPASEAGSWSGPYVGAFVGFGVGNMHMLYDSVTFEDDPATPEPDLVMVVHHRGGVSDHPINGLVFGAAAGVDASLSERVVAGLAVDVAVNNIEAVGGGGMTHPYRIGLDWHASLRGKIGLDEGTYLPYLTGGLAIAGGDYREGPRTASETHLGWTAGAGVEVYTSGNASIDMQYRYSDYRLQTYVIRNTGDFDLGYTTHAATVGVNWRF